LELPIADGELWLPASKQVVVDTLLEALHERASIVLVGEPADTRERDR